MSIEPQIKTYSDLMEEKARLQALVKTQKEVLRQDFQGIKDEFKPVKEAVSFLGKFASKDKSSPLLSATSDTLINMVVRNLILAKSGWATKLVVPMLLKNYSSHVLSENKGSIFKKVFSLFSKKDKGHTHSEFSHQVKADRSDVPDQVL